MNGSSGVEVAMARSRVDIERCAGSFRRFLGFEMDQSLSKDAAGLFERLDRYGIRLGDQSLRLTYEVKDLPRNLLALSYYDEISGEIVVAFSEPQYLDLLAGTPRAMFTLGHEIGHAVLHAADLIRMGRFPIHSSTGLARASHIHPAYRDSEWQANEFGAALLMPARGIARLKRENGVLAAPAISDHFGTSLESAEIRLGIFEKHQAKLLRR